MTKEEAIEKVKFLCDNACNYYLGRENEIALYMVLEALQEPEAPTLTYDEKCIFLAAMGREKRICQELDEEPEIKAKPLVPIVDEIERKVKAVLWGENNG